jgi:hypothetical protein
VHTPFESFVVDFIIDGLAVLPFLVWIGVLVYLYDRRPIQNEIRATLWAIAISYVFAHVNRWFGLWQAYPNFPSGHMTFASCVWTELALIDRRYVFAAPFALALLAYALFHSAWHGRVDIVGGFALGSLVMLALRRLWKP